MTRPTRQQAFPPILRAVLALVTALAVLGVLGPRAEAFIYWTNEDGIARANLDGTGVAESFLSAALPSVVIHTVGFECEELNPDRHDIEYRDIRIAALELAMDRSGPRVSPAPGHLSPAGAPVIRVAPRIRRGS